MKYLEIALLIVPFLLYFLAHKQVTRAKAILTVHKLCAGIWGAIVFYSLTINLGFINNIIPEQNSLIVGYAFVNTFTAFFGVALYIVSYDFISNALMRKSIA